MAERSKLGFGCVSLTQHAFLKDADNLLSLALAEGITHFDTAPLYGNGYSEKILGSFIKNKRSQVTITTKCGLGNSDQPSLNLNIALPLNAIKNKIKKNVKNAEIQQPTLLQFRLLDRDYIQRSLEKSLANLQTDYIDNYFLHEAMPSFLTEDAYLFLKEQQQKGVINQLGIAAAYINFLQAENKDVEGFTVLQYENGPLYKTDGLLIKFSDKKHFYHSALKSIPYLNKVYPQPDWAGILLNKACKSNPLGKVLFSTTKLKRLKENLTAFDRYDDLPLSELNNIIDGIH